MRTGKNVQNGPHATQTLPAKDDREGKGMPKKKARF